MRIKHYDANGNLTGYSEKEGPNHLLHFILTLCTGGLWIPVWIVISFL